MKRYYFRKLIISGSNIELYRYQEPIVVGRKRQGKPVKRRTKEELIKEASGSQEGGLKRAIISSFSLRRTRAKIVRLINSNPDLNTFVTLTFDNNCSDLAKANAIFNRFIKRLRRQVPQLKYLAIPEFQKDYDFYGKKKENGGAVHYHLLVNFEMRSSDLERIWDQGFVKINKIKHVKFVGLYISKYLSKDMFDLRFFGMRKIMASRNLKQAIIMTVLREIVEYFNQIKDKLKLLSETSYHSDYLGQITYRLYGQ
jgi:hypothetical protein